MKNIVVLLTLLVVSGIGLSQTFQYKNQPMGVSLALAMDSQGNIYQAVQMGGVYISADKGGSWSRIGGSSLGATIVNSFGLDKEGKLIACTDQSGIKIYQGNKTWTAFNNGLPKSGSTYASMRAITLDSVGNYFAGAHSWYGQPNGIFKAQDTTIGWSDASSGIASLEINCLITNIDGKVYCGTDDAGVFVYENNKWKDVNYNIADKHINCFVIDKVGNLFVGTNSGISVITKNGTTWSNNTIQNTSTPVISIAVDETSNKIFAGLGFKSNQAGNLFGKIYSSTDFGINWIDAMPNIKTVRMNALLNTLDGNIFASTQGVLKSTDKGISWNPANNGFKDGIPYIYGRGFAYNKNETFYMGSEFGVWKSNDQGITWAMINNGIKFPNVSLLFCDSKGTIFAGCYAHKRHTASLNKLYRSTNDGDSWDTVNISPDDIYSEMTESENGGLYIAHGFGAKYPSPVYGSSLSVSKDGGLNWEDLPCFGGKGFSVAVTKQGTVLFGGETLGIFRSTDKGKSWDTTIHVGPGGNMAPLGISPDGTIFTSAYGTYHNYFSKDDGLTYTNMIDDSYPLYTGMNTLTWDNSGRMYVGLSALPPKSALYYADPPWTANTKFIMVPNLAMNINKLFFDKQGYMWIYAAGALLKSDTTINKVKTGIETQNNNSIFLETYPNPTNSDISVTFLLDKPTKVKVSLLNLIGEEIITVNNEYNEAGIKILKLNCNYYNLKSGIYFVCLQKGEERYLNKISIVE